MRNGLSTVLQGSAVEVLIDSRSSLNMVILINKLENSGEMSRPENCTLHPKEHGMHLCALHNQTWPVRSSPKKTDTYHYVLSVEGTSPRRLVGLLRP